MHQPDVIVAERRNGKNIDVHKHIIIGEDDLLTAETWYQTPLGQYVLAAELHRADRLVSDVFGFNALQIGMPEYDYLRGNRIPFKFRLASSGTVELRADALQLPIASHSVDLIVLPHVLEFAADPHQILREAERVLIPEGHILISGFNPFSLWQIKHWYYRGKGQFPWNGKWLPLIRLKDWLSLLGMEERAGLMGCYVPPFDSPALIERFAFLEAAGDRWWAMGGGVYMLLVQKKVHGMRLIKPGWHEQIKPRRAVAAATQKTGNEIKHG